MFKPPLLFPINAVKRQICSCTRYILGSNENAIKYERKYDTFDPLFFAMLGYSIVRSNSLKVLSIFLFTSIYKFLDRTNMWSCISWHYLHKSLFLWKHFNKKKSIAVIIRFAIFTKLLFVELSIKKFQRAQTFYFHVIINLNPNRSS